MGFNSGFKGLIKKGMIYLIEHVKLFDNRYRFADNSMLKTECCNVIFSYLACFKCS